MCTVYKSQMDTEKPSFDRRLFCIEYPGRVNNVNNALQTLGSLDTIGTAYGSKNRRVELRFRPDDVYCKPACGDRHATIGLLIRVKVNKRKRDVNMPCSSRDSEKLHSMTFVTSLVGVVDTVYKFDNLCDFQYLPMDAVPEQPNGLRCIYDRLLPDALPSPSWLAEDDAPYFLTPPVFSRFDTIHYYSSSSNQRSAPPSSKQPAALQQQQQQSQTTIGRTRRMRQGYGIFVNYSDNRVPARPNPEALRALRIKFLSEQHYRTLRRLFDERPVWSKNGLLYRTGFSREQLKHLLPTVAYYFVTGPWRVMWCRYGYDPRRQPDSCRLQTFDYRVRRAGGFKSQVHAKRSYSNYLLPYKSSPSSRPKVVIISRHSIARAVSEARSTSAAAAAATSAVHESSCVFRPGFVPPTRQMFYQYCDVLVPEVQAMLRRLPEGPRHCHSTLGFLPAGFDARCREIVNSLVSAELRERTRTSGGKEAAREQDASDDDDRDPDQEQEDEEQEHEDDDDIQVIDSDMDDSLGTRASDNS